MSNQLCYVMTNIIKHYNMKGEKDILEKVYTQYSLPKAIKKFGTKGYDNGYQEMKQMYQRIVFNTKNLNELTKEEKKKALELLIFVKEKKDGQLKKEYMLVVANKDNG